MNITEQEVRRVAELANLALTEEEIARMARDLSGILEHVDKLNELDTTGVEPMAQVLFDAEETATLREDRERPPLGNHDALANAPVAGVGLFQGSQGDRALDARKNLMMRTARQRTHTIDSIRSGLLAKEFSAEELTRAASGLRRSRESQDQRLSDACAGTRPGRRARGGRQDRRGRRSRRAGRSPHRGEGRDRHARPAHHLRLAAAGQLHSALRRHRGHAPGSRPAA